MENIYVRVLFDKVAELKSVNLLEKDSSTDVSCDSNNDFTEQLFKWQLYNTVSINDFLKKPKSKNMIIQLLSVYVKVMISGLHHYVKEGTRCVTLVPKQMATRRSIHLEMICKFRKIRWTKTRDGVPVKFKVKF